ncbi:GLOD4 family protein [Megaselia abdita]
MIGYGPESSHFVIELTYNYGVKKYDLGNDFGGLTIKSGEILSRAKQLNYPISKSENGEEFLTSPDGYKVFVQSEVQSANADPVVQVSLNITNLKKSKQYWNETLKMGLIKEDSKSVIMSYGKGQASLRIDEVSSPLERAKAYGRIAFAVPKAIQPKIDETIKAMGGTILTPLITLDTPGKATVTVIILADPDGHEICFVDEEGFSELSAMEEDGDAQLEKYIKKDPYQD